MKRLVMWAVALCLAAGPVHAQSVWEWQYPPPQGNNLNNVGILLPSTAVAVGGYGAVVKSTDQGATWTLCTPVSSVPALNAVSVLDANTFVAVGGNSVARSTNGGYSWSMTYVGGGGYQQLYDVDFADDLHGIAVGLVASYDGIILTSDDGGITWVTRATIPGTILRGVCVVDATTAFAVGQDLTILHSSDGGVTWDTQNGGGSGWLYDVDFIDTSTGTAVGYASTAFNPPLSLKTSDGGLTWIDTHPWPLGESRELHAVDQVTDLVTVVGGYFDVGPQGLLYSTNNGWGSWSENYVESVIEGVGMFSTLEGVAVGDGGAIYRTTDGGQNWTHVAGGLGRYLMSDVDFLDPQHGVATATDLAPPSDYPTSRMYLTSDGGATWSITKPFTWSSIADVSYPAPNTIVAVGRGPSVMDAGAFMARSTDGGATWTNLVSSECYPGAPDCVPSLVAVDFLTADTGVAVGDRIYTLLGGVLMQGPDSLLTAVSVPSSQTAYAVGSRGLIMKGDLPSNTWTRTPNFILRDLVDVCFVNDLVGWVVGYPGSLLHTTDGGVTWTETALPSAVGSSISFIDEFNGVFSGYGTRIWKTINGGNDWFMDTTPTAATEIVMIDIANVVAVGGHENIIARRDNPVPVFFQDVTASVKDRSVEVRWAVYADEAIQGYRIYRDDAAVTGDLIPPPEHVFVDAGVVPETEYRYVVAAVGAGGTETRSWPVTVRLPAAPVALYQNTPNPFNPVTEIGFALPAPMHVTLTVYDIAGHRVAVLAEGMYPAGEHAVTWDGTAGTGDPAASGIYFYELRTPRNTMVRKMALLK